MAGQPIQWICAKCGTIMGDEQSERAVRELRAELEKLRNALNAPDLATIRSVAKGIGGVWTSENKSADIEQVATLFEPSARAALTAIAKLAAKQPP
jgi:hypothetical protein